MKLILLEESIWNYEAKGAVFRSDLWSLSNFFKILSVVSQCLPEIEVKLLVFYDKTVERKKCFIPVLKLRRVFSL